VGGGIVCTKDVDRLVEETCTATLTYECPCGVEVVTLSTGENVGECRRLK
jgi:hypothetical protein